MNKLIIPGLILIVVIYGVYYFRRTNKNQLNYNYPIILDDKIVKEALLNDKNCGSFKKPLLRIMFGNDTSPGQYPWMCFITNSDGSICGGTLISSQWVLTAAHCRVNVQSIVHLGQYDKSVVDNNTITKRVLKSIPHENFTSDTFLNDICLLYLDSPVVYTEFIQPICIADKEYNVENQPLKILGWGLNELGSTSNSLMETTIYSTLQCSFPYLPDKQICCLNENTGACFGDSGGPLVLNVDESLIQIGIISYGGIDCIGRNPSIFTKISAYFPWIRKNTTV